MLKYPAILASAFLALWPSAGLAAPVWQQWQTVPGVFDLGGPRADGSLVVAGSTALYTVTSAGDLRPFARGLPGYRGDPGPEAYLAVSPGQRVKGGGCAFTRDDVYILRLHPPIGVTRVDRSGVDATSFVNLGVPSLSGIAFDSVGAFDHRLLLTAPVNGRTAVIAVDCKYSSQVITATAPPVEGGIAVAPETFGAFAGSLIAPDELTGSIWAIAPDGVARLVVTSGLAAGGDIGVESVGFVPPGFTNRGGFVYLADRGTANNPHPGTDSILRLSSADVVAAGVRDGDLLAATEGGAAMIAVHCDASCRVTTVVPAPTTAHGEGHVVFTVTPQSPSSPTQHPGASARPAAANASSGVAWILALVAVVLTGAGAAVVVLAADRVRRR